MQGGLSTPGAAIGPATATDNAIVRFDATTGKLLQNSTITISDAGVIAGATQYVIPVGSDAAPALAFESNYGFKYTVGTHTLAWVRAGTDFGDFQLSPSGVVVSNIVCSNVRSYFGLQSSVNTDSLIRCDTSDGNTWRIQTNNVVSMSFTSTAAIVGSGIALRLGGAAATGLTPGVLAATTDASIIIQDSTGQAYEIPCIAAV